MENLPPPPPLTTMENLPPPPPLTATNNLPPPPPFAYSNNLPPPPPLTTAKNLPPPPPPPATTINFPPPPPRTPTENLPPPPPLPPPHLPQPIRCSSALPSPSLSTTLQHLTSLLQLTTATLAALPSTLPTHPTSNTLPCPHNPSHLIPPSSLFSHYLNCPSTVVIPPITPNNFFYQNCPSAVKLPSDNPSPQTPTLALPPILLNECDVSNPQDPWTNGDDSRAKFFLPSEIWHLRSELESWGFGGRVPISCSCTVLRAFIKLRQCRLSFLREWIVDRSLKYGIVIDFPLADRIIVLVVLCLKALVKYALGLLSNTEVKTQPNQSFDFPVLGQVLAWLGLLFAVLCGEANGRSLAMDVIRECVIKSAYRCCLFPLNGKCKELNEIKEVVSGKNEHIKSVIPIDEVGRDTEEIVSNETVMEHRIFVSQVEEAIVKLHERSVVEAHIKTLRDPHLPSPYQRCMAHEHASKIAEEERKRRPDYKAIIEHDGLLTQRLNDMDTTGKRKTRRELLAEERDYRRRRMSYRGKKLKRSTLEVTRDIIEEYMEAIKEAGGITGNDSNVQKTEALVPEKRRMQTVDDRSALTKKSENENRDPSPYPRKGFFSRHDSERFEQYSKRKSRDARSEPALEGSFRYVETKQSSEREKSYHVESSVEGSKHRSSKRIRESPERRRYTDEHEHERNDHRRHRDERKREHNDRKRYSDDEYGTHRKRERHEDDREYDRHGNRKKSKSKSGNSSSRPEPHKFEDRYDPADSEYSYENLD